LFQILEKHPELNQGLREVFLIFNMTVRNSYQESKY
jgi:hypothetical protein